jgi:hypothetical protein
MDNIGQEAVLATSDYIAKFKKKNMNQVETFLKNTLDGKTALIYASGIQNGGDIHINLSSAFEGFYVECGRLNYYGIEVEGAALFGIV